MVRTYPICLVWLDKQRTLVIGGGHVAARKAAALLEAGANVTAISPVFCPEFDALAALQPATPGAPTLTRLARPYQDGDLDGAFLVVAATDVSEVNHAVFAEATRRGCLVNVVDDPQHSNFIVPAVVRRGEVAAALTTGGASPALARRMRERLEDWLRPSYGDLAAIMSELRPYLLAHFPAGEARLQAALALVDSELQTLIERDGPAVGRAFAHAWLAERAQSIEAGAPAVPAIQVDEDVFVPPAAPGGLVYLIGAGPGDPGLITVRGVECLRRADVVVHDRLANPALLDYAPRAERIDVGKQPDHHPVPQTRINQILVAQAQAGKIVARLKGGDPFVFGRGGEEALALLEAGLPFEVVPGITSAIAVPAYAGIPVTQRGMACNFIVVTGHRSQGQEDDCSWIPAACAADTRIFLMGVQNLPGITAALLDGGVPADTPAAVIAHGTLHDQSVVDGTLADIAVRAAQVQPPAITVIGAVAGLRQKLHWFDHDQRRPLLGLRVLNTRAREAFTADDFRRRLNELGAQVLDLPATRLAPPADLSALDTAIHDLAQQPPDWLIFASANGVTAFFDRLLALGYDARCLGRARLGAVGQATADALAGYHLRPDFVPSRYTGLDWAAEVGDLHDQRVLLPRSEIAPPDLPQALTALGAQVRTVTAYRSLPGLPDEEVISTLRAGLVDVITLFSPSALDGLLALLGADSVALLNRFPVAVIGPTTAQAARQAGVRVDLSAEPHTLDGMLEALIAWRGR